MFSHHGDLFFFSSPTGLKPKPKPKGKGKGKADEDASSSEDEAREADKNEEGSESESEASGDEAPKRRITKQAKSKPKVAPKATPKAKAKGKGKGAVGGLAVFKAMRSGGSLEASAKAFIASFKVRHWRVWARRSGVV